MKQILLYIAAISLLWCKEDMALSAIRLSYAHERWNSWKFGILKAFDQQLIF